MTGRYVGSTLVEDQKGFVENLQIGKQIGKLLDMPKRPQAQKHICGSGILKSGSLVPYFEKFGKYHKDVRSWVELVFLVQIKAQKNIPWISCFDVESMLNDKSKVDPVLIQCCQRRVRLKLSNLRPPAPASQSHHSSTTDVTLEGNPKDVAWEPTRWALS